MSTVINITEAAGRGRLGAPEVAGHLRREIEAGRYKAHERLPAERALASELNVARGTVRDALTRLADQGFVEIRPGSGAYVVPAAVIEPRLSAINSATPLELVDARFALEPHICRLAVLNARDSDLVEGRGLIDRMDEAVGDPEAFARLDTSFHRFLARMTGNRLLMWIIDEVSSVRTQTQWARMLHVTLDRSTVEAYIRQHSAILDAIESRDPETAARAMRSHLEHARLSLTRAAST